jgi:hypothetical protein
MFSYEQKYSISKKLEVKINKKIKEFETTKRINTDLKYFLKTEKKIINKFHQKLIDI